MRVSWKQVLGVVRRNWLLIALVIVFTLLYSAVSLSRHWHFGSSGFDLGIFDQAIWHYSRFEIPESTTRNVPNLLGDHFHPILVLLAPFYWVFPGIGVLLVGQAFLMALAMVPIFLFTRKRLGRIAGYCFAVAYALYWGIQSAVAYDFHEVAFAVPLIAFAIYFLDKAQWRWYLVSIGLLLLVKEDLSILVAFFGILLLVKRQYKLGAITLAAGISWFFLATKVFIPAFAGPGGGFVYWTYSQFGASPMAAAETILKNPWLVIEVLLTPRLKAKTGLHMFSPFAFLAVFSPLVILAIPLVLERFLSTNMNYWAQDFHYTATLAPIVAMASADGLYNLVRLIPRRAWRSSVVIAVSGLVLGLNVVRVPGLPLYNLTNPNFYSIDGEMKAGYAAMARIPRDASVVAQDAIIPHISQRQSVYQLKPGAPAADYIIASKSLNAWPSGSYIEIDTILKERRQQGYQVVFERDGWTVLKEMHD